MTYLTAAYTIVAMVVSVCLVVFAFVLSLSQPRAPRDHLCQIAEISPDMTVAERERCRMLRMYKEGKTL